MLDFLTKLFNAIASFFQYRAVTHNQDTLQSLYNEQQQTKNKIIAELNKSNPDMFYIKRLYHQLQNLYDRQKYL